MAIRYDIYTVYKGKEYRIGRVDDHYEIVGYDPGDLDLGFIEYKPERKSNPRIFFKEVSPSEIGDVYEISTYALYQGYEFWIKREEENRYLLKGNKNITLMKKLDFQRVDKYGYEKLVRKEDLDLIYEKKTLMPNFFK
ncbi:hypothetical protein BWD09_12780 [Neisseria dentiae]|uniref:Uncharacterized protein n=1 Tax=Neisseria dentiae TaxID=194197 RepID=A0A1X3D2I7_9NEIS|nr:hypothetical protein [Neisseria dentiae]OSI13727.1 hypothetical protein BWD09_12780 [Neisseria dentiae]STZ50651.1 Uncharacterised protein [Neisseria dentiae]